MLIGQVRDTLHEAVAGRLARLHRRLLRKAPGVSFRVEDVSGRPGLVGCLDGVTAAVIGIDLTQECRIGRLWLMMHPDKLHAWHTRGGR
ncbi:hypothetical protein ACFYWP_18020 [Actinacidiphila glaucinigra]|uniref:hypothetical protein n=1 Tax=Actinacidiphila glaucinigra TaxID=235986 RepID=UPI0036A5B22B